MSERLIDKTLLSEIKKKRAQWEKALIERVEKAFGGVAELTQYADIPETLGARALKPEEQFKRKAQPKVK